MTKLLAIAGTLLLAACGSTPVEDPATPGPYATATLDGMTTASSGDVVPIHAVYPSEATAPLPVIVLGHGFQIPVSQYESYLTRLASFGFIAIAPDYPDPLTGPVNNINDGKDLAAGLDWAAAHPTLRAIADVQHAGVMGHSRGGKAAVLAALQDSRFKAVYGVDPVDAPPPAGVTCDPDTQCPAAYEEIASLTVPTLFVGETLDSMGGLACAPAAGNYAVFFAHANAPSVEVTVNGASHMSFVDDPVACGVVCQICQTPTLRQDTALGLATAYAVAFFERHLRSVEAYDAYLTGTQAQQRYVDPGIATISSK